MLLLTAGDVRSLLDYPSCIAAVEESFARHGRGECEAPAVCGVHVVDGGFHVKAAALDRGRPYFAAKVNANFPSNPRRHGLPTIQGAVLLFDAAAGVPLALLDSVEITLRRTAAATAVAAKYLARADAATVALCGCGIQGRAHLHALREVLEIRRVVLCDTDEAAARRLADDFEAVVETEIGSARDYARHARSSDICITCTPSREYLLDADDVQAGSFVAGVGADSPEKRELTPELLACSRVVVDVLDQCAVMGDLHHALTAEVMARATVHGELGEIVAGTKPGRTSSDEIFVFDSTGTGFQDVAAAAVVYERALLAGRGREFSTQEAS